MVIRTKSGRTLERNEVGTWSEMGKGKSLVNFDEEADFPATVIWSYAEQIGDATVEALAELATAMLTANFRQQQMAQQQAAEQQAEEQEVCRRPSGWRNSRRVSSRPSSRTANRRRKLLAK